MPESLPRAGAPLLPLLERELRALAAGRALWVMALLLCPVVGYGFTEAVGLYAEASRSAEGFPELARGMTPLDGVLVPTLGAFYVAVTLLFPFVAIRTLGGDKENGGLKLLLQLPHSPVVLVLAKLAAAITGWLLALVPALSALFLWAALGGHLHVPETLNLLLGHLLYGLLVAAVGLFAASVADGPATAAIGALAFVLGAWVLDFAAAGQGAWMRRLADLSPTAALRGFEGGLLALPAVLGMLIAAAALVALAVVWLPPGRPVPRKLALSAAVLAAAAALSLASAQARLYADLSESRRNSFAPGDEAALRRLSEPLAITVHLSPDDPRLADFERQVLGKLRRLVPRISVTIAETPKGLLTPSGDDRYGLVFYDYGARHDESRSTSFREVLPLLFALAGATPERIEAADYPGYPLVADARPAAPWFYAVLPALLALAWWRVRRAGAAPDWLQHKGGVP
ncbi:ABC transporter permease subunit [Dankookia rubra]|nr:ABC transporter permease subunit [Dankookia rubra]